MSPRLNWRIIAAGLAIAAVVFLATAFATRGTTDGADGDLLVPTPIEEPVDVRSIPLLTPVEPLPEDERP